MPIGAVGGSILAGSVISAGVGAYASMSAADKAASASKNAAALQQQQAAQNRADLLPYNQTGQTALGQINASLPAWGTPDNTDLNAARGYYGQAATLGSGPGAQAALAQTPGYQFAQSQGLQAAQNAAAARGLGVSGAALKGAATFATGLADQTYGEQFNRLLTSGDKSLGLNTALQGNLTNSYNRLLGTASLGENAAAQTGNTGANLTNAAAGNIVGAGAAQTAGLQGAGNAVSGNISSGMQNYLLQQGIANGSIGNGQTRYQDSAPFTA